MFKLLTRPTIPALLLALTAFGWTADNEAVSSAGLEAELQPELGCAPPHSCEMVAPGYLMHWVSKTRTGNLFLVLRTDCNAANQCGAWFVERTARGVGMRLNVDGRFRVLNSASSIPDVETWREVSENEVVYTRYSWMAGTFVKSDSRTVYRVDGEECGTALECYQAARQAYETRKADKALNIWEKVHKVSWI
jgi:hypothetical protein